MNENTLEQTALLSDTNEITVTPGGANRSDGMLRQQKVKPVEDQKNDTGLQFERLKSNDDSEQKVDEQEL